jgi:hypothetical protein
MDTTVRELVMKHASMSSKLQEVFVVIHSMQDKHYDKTEVIERAEKDQRYPMILLVNEYKRLAADIIDLESTPVRLLND